MEFRKVPTHCKVPLSTRSPVLVGPLFNYGFPTMIVRTYVHIRLFTAGFIPPDSIPSNIPDLDHVFPVTLAHPPSGDTSGNHSAP